MKLSDISSFLNGNISAPTLKLIMSDEVREYIQLSSKVGSTIPIYVIEDLNITITVKDVKRLCEAFLSHELLDYDIALIVDTFELSDCVQYENNDLVDILCQFTDPEVNGKLTEEFVKSVLNKLK